MKVALHFALETWHDSSQWGSRKWQIVDTHMYKGGHVPDPWGGGRGCLVRGKLWKSLAELGVID